MNNPNNRACRDKEYWSWHSGQCRPETERGKQKKNRYFPLYTRCPRPTTPVLDRTIKYLPNKIDRIVKLLHLTILEKKNLSEENSKKLTDLVKQAKDLQKRQKTIRIVMDTLSTDDKERYNEDYKNEVRYYDEESKDIMRDIEPDYYEHLVDSEIKEIVDRDGDIHDALKKNGYYVNSLSNIALRRAFLKIPIKMKNRADLVSTIKKEINYHKDAFPGLENKLLGGEGNFDEKPRKELKKILATLRHEITLDSFVPAESPDSSAESPSMSYAPPNSAESERSASGSDEEYY